VEIGSIGKFTVRISKTPIRFEMVIFASSQ
jgi:hypothetical protein